MPLPWSANSPKGRVEGRIDYNMAVFYRDKEEEQENGMEQSKFLSTFTDSVLFRNQLAGMTILSRNCRSKEEENGT